MISRSLAVGLLAAGCVAAAGGGAYVAVRQNAVQPPAATTAAVQTAPAAAQQPVAETEALVAPRTAEPVEAGAPVEPRVELTSAAPAPRRVESTPAERRETTRNARVSRRETAPSPRRAPAASSQPPAPVPVDTSEGRLERSIPAAPVESVPEPPRYAEPPAPPEPQFEEVTVPASAVIGLQIETAVSSERAQVEDRVGARVTRDVMSQGRVAIPAGSRVLGSVTLVEKGGKVKERARLGVRFHTLVLADGSELPLRTEAILREGESPAGDSSRKIGGAAVGGAILGAILGGGKGAVIGGATGAAGGTAVVMAGDRHAATLPNGTILTVRLSSPVDVQVEKH
jgi:type IV secretory pathway VirB10-like protein